MTATDDKARTVRGYFNAIAGRYDLANTLLSFGLHYLWKRRTIKEARISPGASVLDLCGGTADLALRAAKAGAQSVMVCDFSAGMLSVGKKKAAAVPAISFICGDAQRIACTGSSFDVVLIGFGLRNLVDKEQGLREMLRVLRPGGRLVCLEFSTPVWPWFRLLYDFYSRSIIPTAGLLIAGSREAYEYLPDSIKKFPLPDDLAALMQAAGFRQVRYTRLTNGIAAIHTAEKP
ncbi:MAG: bifunctional demethylmenaquinone methyltransferase/2-methoxy-6-polyprenyl-1,4-benzoquinol methylase UbiE [Deltaproteobacteria bacterium]|nr:bifunctional demethylmenaquinone methyltransferase/2-methoxy-6-polyprenyl-1,4-benzoquinol methylase UbiE [Deltaproteobacteria bacterium]